MSDTDQKPSPSSSHSSLDLSRKKKRNRILLKIILIILLASLTATIYWYLFIRLHESTDDAYIAGNTVNLMSPQNGTVTGIYVDNTDFVKQGQLLLELDPTLYQLIFDKAQVELALATRQVKQLFEAVKQRTADVTLKEADLKRAQQDFDSRNALRNTQAISTEDLNHAQANLNVAQASLNLTKHELNSAIAALGVMPIEEHPRIENAKIALKEAYVNLKRCKILAPVSGYIAQRRIQVGEWITPTRALLSVIPLEQIWVDANFKETELSDIRIGQPATIESDMYGSSLLFHGKVLGITAGTGSVFSLIPPQNATGNWIKIVQRVPVRIALDLDEVKKNPLVLGLSAYVVVDTSNQTGKRLATRPFPEQKFTTPVYQVPMEPVEELIQTIIRSNLSANE
ncbi:Multidrug resistance protein A [Candidatus Protochlamydia naegleriophila]|uniref:Multidrug resistance protein A n=1 Tax=Candidatus Protochlamydia naegleriophila TaxID=389348 RepID=A0A0U5JIR3_9BACT|nr:HlyD family efflux transporter periplasmic adaptor subunit [Candidatus Protochlamydia naegleriophila]CUI17861.1 Multidrug resistance protein A [Candidatus Protochlamydia naegleriophila]